MTENDKLFPSVSADFRLRLAAVWRERASVTRRYIFGKLDPLRPIAKSDDTDTAAPGMVGQAYIPGGVVLLSINPAGGKDDAASTVADREMYSKFRNLRDSNLADVPSAFEAVNEAWQDEMPKWKIYKQRSADILEALAVSLDQIAYVYVVPFRTRGDDAGKIKPDMVDRGYEGLERQLRALEPGCIVAMDRKAEDCARRFTGNANSCRVWYYPGKRDDHVGRKEVLREMVLSRVPFPPTDAPS